MDKQESLQKKQQVQESDKVVHNQLQDTLKFKQQSTIKNQQKAKNQIQQISKDNNSEIKQIVIEQNNNNIDINDDSSEWTDESESQIDCEDDIIVVDDDILEAMDDSDEQNTEVENQINEDELQNGSSSEQDSNEEKEKQKIIKQLQQQFVTNGKSQHHMILGKHNKFCVSVHGITCVQKTKTIINNSSQQQQTNLRIFSGGGDDHLLIYTLNHPKNTLIQPYYSLKHTQTINKISTSYDNKYVFSMSDKEIWCMQILTEKLSKMEIQSPNDICCHHLGGVIAVAQAYTVHIYNIKGLQLYGSYGMDTQISHLSFTQSGKQLLAAGDNKLRILTPKTSEIVKATGANFHTSQITSMINQDNIIYTGCIDGYICTTNATKGNVLNRSQSFQVSVNKLLLTQNYLICSVAQPKIWWMDCNKLHKIFQSTLQSTSTDLIKIPFTSLIAVATIGGCINLFDHRNPLKPVNIFKAGNTIHQLWSNNDLIAAACEDGFVRIFNLKMCSNKQQ